MNAVPPRPVVELRELRSGLPHEAAFTLTVMPHETVVVLGAETTGVDDLGGMILGLREPAGGTATLLGTEVATLPRRAALLFRRRIGYLPAGDGLLHNLSLRDNIRLPLSFGSDFPPEDIETRVNLILAQIRLSGVGSLRPAQATEEQRRRAALGRAVALDPVLAILEQPFDGLTDQAAAELLEIARGGETGEGGHRAVLITGQDLPTLLRPRVERVLHAGHRPAGVA